MDYNLDKSRLLAWISLLVAICFEVSGVSILKIISNPLYAKLSMIFFVNLSYIFMALALRDIALGVAYSVWEIVGLLGVLGISFLFFTPHLSTQQYLGILIGFVGVICIVAGEEH
ncbi:SMR family transporter [Helicobacter sp. 10-6591]|uniref:DMT family transporter n=1 Tax=Helicobacter sp. 10-6591 TaxID=2004998 RepID=UPI00320820BC